MQNKYFIANDKTINFALKKINKINFKTLLVLDKNNNYLGTLSEGDIRRGILKFKNIRIEIDLLYNKKSITLDKEISQSKLKNLFKSNDIDIIPLIKKKKVLDIFLKKEKINYEKNNIDVAIMAGGFAKRLKPYSDIFPKPLMPFKNNSLIKNIILNFKSYGIKKFNVLTFYKSQEIKKYLNIIKDDIEINIFREKIPMGTVGGLCHLKKNNISEDFWVINCDTILNVNYNDIYKFHKKNKSDLTIVGSKKKLLFPYGHCLINKKKKLLNIYEKPVYNLLVNTGCYIFNKKILKYLSNKKPTDFNELLKKLKLKRLKIFVYNIKDNQWQDFGEKSSFQIN